MRETTTERQDYWRNHLTAWRQSGQTLKAYAIAQGLSVAQLYRWNRQLKHREAASPALIPVQLRDARSDASADRCRITLPDGLRLDWPVAAKPTHLRALLDALAGRP